MFSCYTLAPGLEQWCCHALLDVLDFQLPHSMVNTPGMSIFRFLAEFRFYFLLSAFLEIIFRFFWKSRRQKKKRRSRCPMPTLSGEFKELAPVERVQRACHCWESSKSFSTRVLAFSSSESKFESTVSPLGSRNLTPATMHCLPGGRGRGGWWSSGEMEGGGLAMMATEPVTVL